MALKLQPFDQAMVRILHQYISAKAILLCAAEFLTTVAIFIAGTRLWYWNDLAGFQERISEPAFGLNVVLVAGVMQALLQLNECYGFVGNYRGWEHFLRVGESLGAACAILGFVYLIEPEALIGRGEFAVGFGLTIVSTAALRLIAELIWRVTPVQNVAIFGSGRLARCVAAEIAKRSDLNWKLVGFISDREDPTLPCPVIGKNSELEAAVEKENLHRVIIAMEEQRGALPVNALVTLRVSGLVVEDVQAALAALTGRVWLETAKPSWFVFTGGFERSVFSRTLKRIADLVIGIFGFVLSLPITILVALAVLLDSKGPILYRQTRVGYRGVHFELLKFRSMRTDAERESGAQWAVMGDPRVTRVGRYLRKFRLDELPQFINVIRGEMSLIGPRPERPYFTAQLREMIPFYNERHSLRPGVTGWAQVRYQYGASVYDAARKLEYDLFYLKNMSFLFDMVILLQTVRTVLIGGEFDELPAVDPSMAPITSTVDERRKAQTRMPVQPSTGATALKKYR